AGTENATPRKAAAAQAPAAWVSTLARARAIAGPAAGTAAAPKPGVELPAPSASALAATGPAAAAALRFAAPVAGPAVATTHHALAGAEAADLADEPGVGALAPSSASARSDAGAREGSGQGARGGAGTPAWVDGPAPGLGANEASAVDSDFGQLLEQQVAGQGLEAVLEPLNQHISLWLAGQVKRANLVLHQGLGQPLEIGLQLDGHQARLDFLTDDAALLEALQAQAPEALSELLEHNGLELVGLSIGARASGQSDRPAQPRPEWARTARAERAEQADAAAQAPTLQWQPGAGRAGLSVYV
ncbi:MAG: flagellar hook-length control protein FliK, partial [Pseudomonadota bacterium]